MDRATTDECVVPVKATVDRDGYPRKKWNKRFWRMNRLLWTWSYGDIPEGSVVAHKCNNKGCINPTHFYLCSNATNSTHAAEDGLYRTKEQHPRAKLTEEQVSEIRTLYSEGFSQDSLAKKFGMSQSNISSIIRKETW